MFVHPFSKYVVNIHYVLGIDVSPGDAAVNKTKFLLLGSCVTVFEYTEP